MGQTTQTGPNAWADNRTWVYTGQVFTGPNGILSIAANNDDTDWFKIDGVVVLNNGAWNVPNATVVRGLTPNSWVDFEFRVGNGNGGAGPSGQNTEGGMNWNNTTGVVFSYEDMTDEFTSLPSLDALAYELGRPTEVADGVPELFRFQTGLGFDDNLRVTDSGTITIDGETPLVAEPSLRFENAAAATLTVNDGTGTHKTLSFTNGTTLATTAPITIAGTSDIRLGRVSDGSRTGVRLIAAGPGQLIIDNVDLANENDLDGTTLEAGAGGQLVIRGSNSVNPIASLTTPLTISGTGGVINIGSTSAGQIYENAITANESGTLAHTTNTADTIGSETHHITVATGKTLTIKNSANVLTVAGNLTGGTVANDGTALVKYTGNANLNTFTNVNGTAQLRGTSTITNLNVTGGRLEMRGDYTIATVPVIANGGTLALLNAANTGTLPSNLLVPSGNLEFVPGAIGTSALTLTGGTITLAPGITGLKGNYYNINPNNTNDKNADFFTRESYTAFFDAQTPTVGPVLTSVGETSVLSFNADGADGPMYERYGFTAINQIISRMDGKINIPVSGTYTFTTRSDDGSVIFINGSKVVDNNSYQGMTSRSGSVFLTAGLHDIDIGFYEGGGGNGLEVFWAGPGIANSLLSNSVLFPDATPTTFANPVDVQQDSTINTIASSAIVTSLTIQPGKTLTTTGGPVSATTLTLNGTGTYTINAAAGNVFTASDIASNGAAVAINKTGPGVFAIDDLTNTTPQLPAGSSITVSEGSLGVLLGGATNPLGSATLTFAGGGVVLSSKNGDQSYAIPALTGNGSIEARQIASGLAGTPTTPINVTLTGNLNVAPTQTVTLGTADNYVLRVGGAATGAGNIVVNGGTVIDTTGTGLQNFNVALNAKGTTANLQINSNTVTLGSLGSDAISTANVLLGTGSGPVTLNFTGSGSGRYFGNLATSAATPLTVVKNGAGSQSIIAPLGSTATSALAAVTVNAGTMELSPAALGSAPITLAGGTLQMIDSGLSLKIWDADPNATGAYGATLNTFAGVQSHYAGLLMPAFIGNTAADGNMTISYNPSGAEANAMFGVHGYGDMDTIEALFTGKIYIATAGSYKFSPRSDDGSTVYINGQPVSLNNFGQGINEATQAARDGTITLTPGYHDIAITFNEGGGGQGLFVDITGPNGLRRTLSNNELFTTDVTATNAVNLTTSSSIDARGGKMTLGALSWTVGTTLTSVNGTAAFSATTLPTAGTYTIAGAGNFEPGAITTTGNATITLHNTGTGSLILNNTETAQLQNSSSIIADAGGRVVVVVDSTVGTSTPLGTAILKLGGAGGSGELVISNKASEEFSMPANLQINGNATISADNAGGGAASGTAASPIVATLTSPVSYGAHTLTLRAGSNYVMQVGGALTGTGPLNVTGGSVATTAAVTAGSVNVSGGRLTTNGSLTASSATVGAGAALRISGTTNVTGGTTVNSGGTLEVNGSTYTGGNINLNDGSLESVGGVNDLRGVVVNGSTPTTTANALTARLYPNFVRPVGGFGTDQGLLNTLTEKAAFTKTLGLQDINFGPVNAGDDAIAAYFGARSSDTGAFTMTFTGRFTAQETGEHFFKESIVDDNASFWVDLNQNGIFELNGSAGSERLASQGCCGPNADPTVSVGSGANLVAGQSYRVVMVLEDTGGGGSFAGRFSTPSLAEAFVNPGAQTGFWSAETGGGTLRVGAESELTLGVANNINDAIFTGTNGTLRFNNATARSTAIGFIRSDTTSGTNSVNLGANDTLTAGLLLVNDFSTISKTGDGTLIVGNIGLAQGATLEVTGGRAVLAGDGVGNGSVLVKGSGTALINGSISGSVTAEAGGTLGGTGTVGDVTLNGGTLAPGNGPGMLTTGALNVSGGTLALELFGAGQGDRIQANSVTLTGDLKLTIDLGTYNPLLHGASDFLVLENLGTEAIAGLGNGSDVVGNFLFTFGSNRLEQNESFTVNGIELKINYFGGTGNDVILTAIPEPGTIGALLCGVGSLLSMRLRRRHS